MSVGTTNAIAKRLCKKGLLTVRKINNRNIRYAVTPEGVEEIARRSYRYLKGTTKNVVDYKEAVGRVVRRAARDGYTAVRLVGSSDVEFIVDQQCAKNGLRFERVEAPGAGSGGSADDAGRTEAGDTISVSQTGGSRDFAGIEFLLYAEEHEPPIGSPGAPRAAAAAEAAYLRTILAQA